ncbi:hypothetical protein M0811_05841 [Anaeramoeba ignava]|uniref:Uncharacterized protein n=1 Tax=Anaeramoeba ignava TaxID=1746090 RepID=A0A9Q0REP7_ANAIG|nr:hypothetical protein M0811_05841 [Anaeramoeba ignava]
MKLFIRFQGNFCVFDAEKILNFKTLIKDVKDNFNIRQKIQAFTYLFQDKNFLLITSEEIPILNVQISISKSGKESANEYSKMIDQDPFLSYDLDTQKNGFSQIMKNILRILDHLETFTTIDFYSRKDIPVFRTSLTKRLFNQIQDKENDLKYGTFCSLLQKAESPKEKFLK